MAAAVVAPGADLTGTWRAEVQPGLTETLELKQAGSALTGFFTNGMGIKEPISEGKADGARISFRLTWRGDRVLACSATGTVSGRELRLDLKTDRWTRRGTFLRAEPAK